MARHTVGPEHEPVPLTQGAALLEDARHTHADHAVARDPTPRRTNQARDAVWKARLQQTDPAFFAELWTDSVAATPKTPDITKAMMDGIMDFNNKYTKDKLDEATANAVYTNVDAERARALK